ARGGGGVRSGTPRGRELGVILCPATDRHARMLGETHPGELVRPATATDEEAAQALRQRGQQLFDDSRRVVSELGLPLEVLDVELLFDGRSAIIQHLRSAGCDDTPLVKALSDLHGVTILLEDLAVPREPEEPHGGCGVPNCGRVNGGGCTTCGSGGGCSSCGSGKVDMRAYFAHLRTKMEENHARIPLA